MKKYAKIINEETKCCEVGTGTNERFYQSIGMTEIDVQQAYDGLWYLEGYVPEKPVEQKQKEIRSIRNSYLKEYVDPKQLVMVWEGLSEDEQSVYQNYRRYLLDYTQTENWFENLPLTFDEWKMK